MSTPAPDAAVTRDEFPWFHAMGLRWNDLDPYRHLNNVRYYTFFDTAIMQYLTVAGGFDLLDGPALPFTVENCCRFHRSFTFPDVIDIGMRVARLGRSSVRYEFGLYRQGDDAVCATGYFVDVFTDRDTQQPVEIPAALRAHLHKLER